MTQFDLQYFAEGEPYVDPDGKNGEPTGDEVITFKSQAAFNARMQREAKKLMENQLKELGFESAEQMKNLLQSAKDQEEAKKTELQKAQERADKAEAEKIQTLNQAQRMLKEAAIQVQAAAHNIKPQRIPAFLKLIDFSKIQIENGTINEASVQEVVQTTLNEIPEFIDKPAKAGEAFREGNDPQPYTLEAIAKMTPAEINQHWDKVQSALKKH